MPRHIYSFRVAKATLQNRSRCFKHFIMTPACHPDCHILLKKTREGGLSISIGLRQGRPVQECFESSPLGKHLKVLQKKSS